MNRAQIVIVVLVLLKAVVESQGLGAEVITYTSNPFTETFAGEGRIDASFEFGMSLTPGDMLDESDLSSWSLSAAGRTFDSELFAQADDSLAPYFGARFVIGDAGLPIEWAFTGKLRLDHEGGLNREAISSVHATHTDFNSGLPFPATGDGFYIDDVAGNRLATAVDDLPFSVVFPDAIGTWALVPEPRGVPQLCLAIGLLLSFRCRATQRLRRNGCRHTTRTSRHTRTWLGRVA
jgi:hypothetical protein